MFALGSLAEPRASKSPRQALFVRNPDHASCMLEQNTKAFAVVRPTDSLAEQGSDLENLELGAKTTMLVLRNGVCDNNAIKGTGVDTGNGIAAENAVGEQGVHGVGTFALE